MKSVRMSLLTTITTATGYRYKTCTAENTAKSTMLTYAATLINILSSAI